jgi:hypothetical protein
MVPTARTTATTVYGTYPSYVTTGTSARDIVTSSNIFVVTVLDSDVNTTTTVTSDDPAASSVAISGGSTVLNGADSTGYDLGDPASSDDILQKTGSGFDTTDDTIQVILTETLASPIVGSVSDVKVYLTGTDTAYAGVSVKSIDSAGDGTNAAKITLGIDYGAGAGAGVRHFDIRYPTSAFDVITASVKSVVDTTGSVVTLTETGRNTGRFEGYVEVQERTARTTQGTGGNHCPTIVTRVSWAGAPALCQGKVKGDTTANAATIPATAGPITITYVDAATAGTSTNVSRTATYSIDVTAPTLTFTAPVTGQLVKVVCQPSLVHSLTMSLV